MYNQYLLESAIMVDKVMAIPANQAVVSFSSQFFGGNQKFKQRIRAGHA